MMTIFFHLWLVEGFWTQALLQVLLRLFPKGLILLFPIPPPIRDMTLTRMGLTSYLVSLLWWLWRQTCSLPLICQSSFVEPVVIYSYICLRLFMRCHPSQQVTSQLFHHCQNKFFSYISQYYYSKLLAFWLWCYPT